MTPTIVDDLKNCGLEGKVPPLTSDKSECEHIWEVGETIRKLIRIEVTKYVNKWEWMEDIGYCQKRNCIECEKKQNALACACMKLARLKPSHPSEKLLEVVRFQLFNRMEHAGKGVLDHGWMRLRQTGSNLCKECIIEMFEKILIKKYSVEDAL